MCNKSNSDKKIVIEKIIKGLKAGENDKEIKKIIYSIIPKTLYKYREFDKKGNNIDSIKNNYIYLSDPIKFNDPYDCGLTTCFSKDVKNIVQETVFRLIRIAALSEVKDSILMWSHYADNHKGFCIEYDTQSLIDNIYPVFYSNKLYDATNFLKKQEVNILRVAAMNKLDIWKYEKEWRIISRETKKSDPKIKAIYLGSKILNADKEQLIKLCNGIDIFQMKLAENEYKLIESKIN